jgi:hypothetical protein
LRASPALKAIVTIAIREGVSIKEVYLRGASDLTLRIARLQIEEEES